MKPKKWHGQAKELYYKEGKNILEIEAIVGITRQTISKFLQESDSAAFEAEKEKRKKDTEGRTKESKKQSKINYQAKQLGVTPEEYEIYKFQRFTLKDELRQQHEDDVTAMSSHGMSKSISDRELAYYRSAYKQTKSGNYRRLYATKDGAVIPELGLPKVIPRRV